MHAARPGAGLDGLDDLVLGVQNADRARFLVADEDEPGRRLRCAARDAQRGHGHDVPFHLDPPCGRAPFSATLAPSERRVNRRSEEGMPPAISILFLIWVNL